MKINRSNPVIPAWKSALGITAISMIAASSASQAALVTGPWAAGLGTPTIANSGTASPVVGTGAVNSADNVAIHSSFSDQSINVGQTITLTGSVSLTGVLAASDQFRFGLYNVNGSAGFTNWLGYFVSNGHDVGGGNLRERNPGANMYVSGTGVSATALTAPGAGKTFNDGTYNFSLSLKRVATGMEISSTLVRSSDSVAFTSFSALADATPQTFVFNRVGFLVGGNLDADQASFSNVDVSVIPEPSSVLIGGMGLLALLRRRR